MINNDEGKKQLQRYAGLAMQFLVSIGHRRIYWLEGRQVAALFHSFTGMAPAFADHYWIDVQYFKGNL